MKPETPLDLTFARKLIEHAVWETGRVWRLALEPLDDAQFNRVVAATGCSIRDECLGQMRQDQALLLALDDSLPTPAISDECHRAALWQSWEAIGKAWLNIAAALDQDSWFADCHVEIHGEIAPLKSWQVVLHFIYSGTASRVRVLHLVADVHQAVAFDLSLMQYLTGVFRQ